MTFTEDLDVFLEEFGVSVSGPSSTSGRGILDQPDRVLGDAMQIISTEYLLKVKTEDFPDLTSGDALTVDGTEYSVREAIKIDDGKFTHVLMSKDA